MSILLRTRRQDYFSLKDCRASPHADAWPTARHWRKTVWLNPGVWNSTTLLAGMGRETDRLRSITFCQKSDIMDGCMQLHDNKSGLGSLVCPAAVDEGSRTAQIQHAQDAACVEV